MLAFDEALERVLRGVPRFGSERVGLGELAGRVLSEDLVAEVAMPALVIPEDSAGFDAGARVQVLSLSDV